MKATKSLFQQLHEANLALTQKQKDIDELVKAITEYVDADGSINQMQFVYLIQKHTKK